MPRGRRQSITEVLQSFGIVLSPEQRVSVQEILRKMEETREIFIVTYPTGGGSQTFPAGISVIDYYEGKITFADNTSDDLLNNLKNLDEPWMRSIFIETDQTIQVSFDDGVNFYQVVQGDFLGLTYQQFQHVYIKTTQDTNISVWATTSPDAVLNKLKADSVRTAAVYRRRSSDLDCSQAARTLDTNFTANFEPAGIWVHFSAAVSPTVSLYRISKLGTTYDTLMKALAVEGAQDVYFEFAKGEGRIKFEDTLRVRITQCNAVAYAEILTEDV